MYEGLMCLCVYVCVYVGVGAGVAVCMHACMHACLCSLSPTLCRPSHLTFNHCSSSLLAPLPLKKDVDEMAHLQKTRRNTTMNVLDVDAAAIYRCGRGREGGWVCM
jgi:hypothetical protein